MTDQPQPLTWREQLRCLIPLFKATWEVQAAEALRRRVMADPNSASINDVRGQQRRIEQATAALEQCRRGQ